MIKTKNVLRTGMYLAILGTFAGAITWKLLVADAATPLRDRIMFGASLPDLPDGRQNLPEFESLIGNQVQITSSFVDWTYVFGGSNDTWMSANGQRQILYSWEPFGLRFTDVTSGSKDAYFNTIVSSMKRYSGRIFVRPWPEMNGNWETWQPTSDGAKPDGGTPAEFIAAWQYTVSYFRSHGVTNLKFVYNPDGTMGASSTPIDTIWPGAQYVDVLGIDGYNWGNDTSGDVWNTFSDIFQPMYDKLMALDDAAPVWICEFGSKEPMTNDGAPIDTSHDKGAWYTDLFGLTSFPKIQALIVFNYQKERDWRIDSSAASLAAVKQQLALRSTTATAPTASTSPITTTPIPIATVPTITTTPTITNTPIPDNTPITTPPVGTAPPSQHLPGDLNADNKIDVYDLSTMLSDWGNAGIGDLDANNTIDILDIQKLFTLWPK